MCRLRTNLRGKDSRIEQLQEKVKRMVKSRDAHFVDEEPVKLKADKMAEEEKIVPVDAPVEKGSR